VQLCCATFDQAYVVAPSFIDMPHAEIQKLRYANDMCGPCMDKGQHIYFSYDVGTKLDDLGEENLSKNDSKFIFKQFSEPNLIIRDEQDPEAIALPRTPRKKKNRGLRRFKNKLLGR
jgi:hypothetical protein